MRIIKEMTYKDYAFALKSIDKDVYCGIITRQDARRSIDKLKKQYQTGEVNRSIANSLRGSKNGNQNYLLK